MDLNAEIYLKFFYLPLAIWMALIVILFAFLLSKYTLGKWTKENPNPYAKETMGLPRGIFRAILTLSLLFAAIVFEMSLIYLGRPESWITEFMTAFQMMIAFYFGSKVMHHVASNDRKKTAERAREAVEVAKVGGSIVNTPYNPPARPTSGQAQTQSDFYDPESAG